MLFIARVMGVFLIMAGLTVLVNPSIFKQFLVIARNGNAIYWSALLKVILGFMLLMAAIECKSIWFVFSFGVLLIIGGMFVFILGIERIRNVFFMLDRKPGSLFHLLGLVIFGLGLALHYSV